MEGDDERAETPADGPRPDPASEGPGIPAATDQEQMSAAPPGPVLQDDSEAGAGPGADPAPHGRCEHCGRPLPPRLRRGGKTPKYCPAPRPCAVQASNARRDARRRAAAALERDRQALADQAGPALDTLLRLLSEHTERTRALQAALDAEDGLEQINAELLERVRDADDHATERIREADAAAARRTAAADQRAETAQALADAADQRAHDAHRLADERIAQAQRAADQRVADHDLARGRAEEQAAAAARAAEQARDAQTYAEQALRDAAERLRAAEEQVDRLGGELQTASDERDAHKRRADQAEHRATTTAETLHQTQTALAEARRQLADAETARDAALTQARKASTRAEDLRTRADNAEQRADREVRRADQATTRADLATTRADRLAAETDRLRTALHLPPVSDVDGVPGVRAGGATVTAASGALHLAGVHQRLDSDAAGELARAMLAVAAHVPDPGSREAPDEP